MLSDRILANYSACVLSFPLISLKIEVKTLKLFLELRLWDLMCVCLRHTGKHTGFVCAVPFAYPWQVCCSAAVCMLFVGSLIKFPVEGFIIFIRQKRENYKPINPCVWSSFSLLPRCHLPSLFCVSRPLFHPVLLRPTTSVMSRGHLSLC